MTIFSRCFLASSAYCLKNRDAMTKFEVTATHSNHHRAGSTVVPLQLVTETQINTAWFESAIGNTRQASKEKRLETRHVCKLLTVLWQSFLIILAALQEDNVPVFLIPPNPTESSDWLNRFSTRSVRISEKIWDLIQEV